ncbi:AMIN-like domain-containing (lipo)protein [Rhodococcus sp. ACT016]|uniref:AMIN-like domain-containing (lipo)protein n=1 Tax=Rhodococcus sp. ACT016 TaxID=3134808 RepID=UPI003D29153F
MKLVIVGVASVLALAGCSGDSSLPQTDSTSGAPATSTPADRTGRMQIGPTPPSPRTLAPVTELPPPDEVEPRVAVDDVRIEVDADTGAERVTFLLTGTGLPFWRAGYVAEAVPYGGGPTILLSGQSILQVDIMGTAQPAGNLYSAAAPMAGPDDSRLTQLFLVPDSREVGGITQAFIGLRGGPAPFEVVTVEDPAQLVLEFRRE